MIRVLKSRLCDVLARLIAPLLKRLAADPRYFELWQSHGFHVSQVHYSQPIPDTRGLDLSIWNKCRDLSGVDMHDENQRQLLQDFVSRFKQEYDRIECETSFSKTRFYLRNEWFGSVDAEVLFCMIRQFKPRFIYEIGSGFSTLLAAEALSRNRAEGFPGTLVAIEPYPPDFLERGLPKDVELRRTFVQKVALAEFEALVENDILFIDSSHVCRIGSDVQFEFLDVLPRLRRGVLVHVHDIFIPREYPKEWLLDRHFFWNEQYLLEAFLCFNTAFEVLWAGQWMHIKHPHLLAEAFSSYRPGVSPGSLWMRRVN